jgi:2-desacetyl-2-hydroxyethyl bacteriochlorophyllide A dehydrogenase
VPIRVNVDVIVSRHNHKEKLMKGVMFTAKGKAELIDEPMPVCKDDTVLLRTIYSGLSNGTERSFLMGGPYSAPWPCRLAYQHVSEVMETGRGITKLAVGDVVFTGTFPGHVEHYCARESDLLVKLPRGFDLLPAALMSVVAVSFHDAQRAQVRPQDNVLVFGAGLIGQFAAQLARVMGARVTVADRHDDRLALARELGADATTNTATPEGMEALSAGKPYSVIFECSGGNVIDLIIGKRGGPPGLVARRAHARLVLVAGRFRVEYDFTHAGGAELDILHTQHFDQPDLEQVVHLVGRGDIRIRPLIRDIVPLSEAPRIFDTLRDDPSKLLGTVFAVGQEPNGWAQ